MKVLKFGGSSVANADCIRKVLSIANKHVNDGQVVLVVSALGGVTNKLEEIASLALSKDDGYQALIQEIKRRHIETASELVSDSDELTRLLSFIENTFSEVQNIANGIALVEELTPKMRAKMMGTGEYLSSHIIHAAFRSDGVQAGYLDSRSIIITDDNYLSAMVDIDLSYQNMREAVKSNHVLFVAPGFIAQSAKGSATTLGRGGSDYTAALFAAALFAQQLEIWTDVDGMLSADPRLVDKAFTIDRMSYEEALELSYFGAKVIYPPTIQPVLGSEIPIYVKNTFNPEHPGTLIGPDPGYSKRIVQGFSSIPDISLVTMSGSGLVGVIGIAYRFFNSLSNIGVNVLFITQSSSEHTITVAIQTSDDIKARECLEGEFSNELQSRKVQPVKIERNLTLVAAVGDGMKARVGVAGKLFSLLGENGVNVRAIAQGSTERNISFVIKDKDVVKALNTLHEGFFLSDSKLVHLFCVGVGNVGGTMLSQIADQQLELKEKYHIDVKVVGLTNSRKMAIMPDGIQLDNWKEVLENSNEKFTAGEFVENMRRLNLRNSVFVDNTAAAEISTIYQEVLNSSISVITSNKIAASSAQANYEELKQTAIDRNVKYLFETNVAAGLPVIKTISDLILTGDTVVKIEAVLSGSLNYIFNNISAETSFSEAVVEARELGYTEPDPSIDLSGKDVMRKILILARESGRTMEMSDVTNNPFLPAGTLDAPDWPTLLKQLQSCDDLVEKQRKEVDARGNKLRYLASLDASVAKVGVQEIDEQHAAYHLGGTDNIILIYTNRYHKQPMVIKGAGAGPQVTASGVLADIMRVANF